ncbi:hypothetical protein ACFWNQ_09475 [Streptomyces virginiae]|uniref:hypothetical protein n=1 Tax=Streptomyces virginiae TaxID=1961 RepID=UPI00365C6328
MKIKNLRAAAISLLLAAPLVLASAPAQAEDAPITFGGITKVSGENAVTLKITYTCPATVTNAYAQLSADQLRPVAEPDYPENDAGNAQKPPRLEGPSALTERDITCDDKPHDLSATLKSDEQSVGHFTAGERIGATVALMKGHEVPHRR